MRPLLLDPICTSKVQAWSATEFSYRRISRISVPNSHTHLHLTHSGFIPKFEKDTAQLSPKWKREKSVSATSCASEECQDLMTPGTHVETTTKLYGMSYRTAHSITFYDQQFGRRRGGKSRGGLWFGGKCCHTRLSLRKRRSSC